MHLTNVLLHARVEPMPNVQVANLALIILLALHTMCLRRLNSPIAELRGQQMWSAGSHVGTMRIAASTKSVLQLLHHAKPQIFRAVLTFSVDMIFAMPHLDAPHHVRQDIHLNALLGRVAMQIRHVMRMFPGLVFRVVH